MLAAAAVIGAAYAGPPQWPAYAAGITALIEAPRHPAPHGADLAGRREWLRTLYSPDAEPLWCADGRPTLAAIAALELLERAPDSGLDPEDYDVAWLRELAARAASADELAVLDTGLSLSVLRLMADAHMGRVDPRRLGFGYHVDAGAHDFGAVLAAAAAAGRVAGVVEDAEPALPQYRRLKQALARYRAMAASGETSDEPKVPAAQRAQQVALAMERLRWLPHVGPGSFLVVNVPAFRLLAFRQPREEAPALQMPVIVGRAARTRTPLFAADMRELIFRPYWYPPDSILEEEILPAARRRAGYLAANQMEIVAGESESSPALPATSANLERVLGGDLRLRQRPGPENALGLLKFVFPNDYTVYMHGTPAQELFGRARRDFSHGCIRVADPAALAEFVLASPDWPRSRIEELMSGARTVRAALPAPVPVLIFYTTAIVRADGTIAFFDDIYGEDAELEAVLRRGSRHD